MRSIFGASWRTTVAGLIPAVIVILTQVGHLLDSDPATVCDWNLIVASLGALGVGFTARDKGVSTEQQRRQ